MFETPGILLEGQRTNVIIRSEELDNAAYFGAATVTIDDIEAPDGQKTAEKLDDTSAVLNENRAQDVTVANDSTTWTVSIFLRKAPAGAKVVALLVELLNGAARDARLFVDPITGASVTGGDVIDATVIDYGDSWRIWLSVANDSSGNTLLRSTFYPAVRATGDVASTTFIAATTGSNHFWGAQGENATFPSSYIKTVASTVVRNADDLSWARFFTPQQSTVYLRGIYRQHDLSGDTARIFGIGQNVSADPRLQIINTAGGDANLVHDNGTILSQASLSQFFGNMSLDDEFELAGQLFADGHTKMTGAVNGGAESSAENLTASPLGTVWAGNDLFLGGIVGGNLGYDLYNELKVAAGLQTMKQVREMF